MVSMRSQQDPNGAVTAVCSAAGARPRARRGPRVALLCLATAILLLGVAAAGAFGYLMISRGKA